MTLHKACSHYTPSVPRYQLDFAENASAFTCQFPNGYNVTKKCILHKQPPLFYNKHIVHPAGGKTDKIYLIPSEIVNTFFT